MAIGKLPKVLVAEDSALIAMSLREVLDLFGFDVVGVAASVTDALCLAHYTQPDLAIFDIHLAGKRDGIEGAASLREFRDIPVVFLTAQGDRETRDRAAELSPAAFLYKPVSTPQMITALKDALRRSDFS